MITLRQIGITDIDTIKKALKEGFEDALGINSCDGEMTGSENELADVLLEKYLRNDWIYKMDNKRAMRKRRSIKNFGSVMIS